ncbi:MAG: sugar transferase [Planctomycetes bacterium]|nr:sugar transferase [Planctomycetota bacterium]
MIRPLSRRLATHVVDQLCILAALSVAGLWSGHDGGMIITAAAILAVAGTFGVVWSMIARRLGAHSIPPSRNLALSLRRTLEAWAATWGLAGMLAVTVVAPTDLRIWLVLLLGAGLLGLARVLMSFSTAGLVHDRLRTIVVGACPSARALTSTKEAREALEFIGFVPLTNEDPSSMPHLPQLGTIDNLPEVLRLNEIDVTCVSPSDQALTGEVHRAINASERLGLQTQYFPSFLDVDDMHVGLTWSANRPGLNVQPIADSSLSTIVKRGIDIAGAAAGLLALLPVFVACALAVKLTSHGPVFFRQTRVGKSGRHFSCLKFRTMRVGAHAQQELLRAASLQDGPAFKMSSDPRITKVGRVLRKFSLDELPQLINVLLGDMSLVGPRPPIPSEVDKYTWWQRRRISVKPGLTCVWQVYGRNRVSFKRWVEMDLYYIDNWSLWLDLKLILHTVRVVLSGTGM